MDAVLGFFCVFCEDQVKRHRHFKLESGALDGVRRFISDRVDARLLAEGKKTVFVTLTRTGNFYDPRYGDFEITRDMLLSMVGNFDADAYGQKIMLDVAHNHGNGGAGIFNRLFVDGNKLRGEVELTEYGIEAVTKKGFIYLSAEFKENFIDNESRKEWGPTLLGAGLTTRPVIKRLDPIQLSEESAGDTPTYLSERVKKLLSTDLEKNMNKLLAELRKKLESFKLSELLIDQLVKSFEAVGTKLAEEDVQRTVMSSFVTQGEMIAKQLSEAGTSHGDITLDLSGLEKTLSELSTGVSEDQVKKLMEKAREDEKKQAVTLAENKQKNIDLFSKLLSEAEGLKSLPEDQLKRLSSASDLITPEMTEEQVKRLAEHQIQLGNDMAVTAQLQGMGYGAGPTGQVHITLDEANSAKALQEKILGGLRNTSHHASGRLQLAEKISPFAEKVLAEFDRLNAPRIYQEHKMLAGGTTGISDTDLPVGFQRTVIREALSDVRILELVQTLTDFGATATTQIPYETRDASAVMNDGIVYEGQPIHRASVTQAMDLAYILPMKLAFLITNEVMHFSRASAINWDAYARNVESNARIMRELVVRRICNELQRAADSYGAVVVSNEGVDGQLDGATVSIVKAANFPIVRPHQQRDLQGNNVGALEHQIIVRLNGVAIPAYDGSGTQSPGTYYRVTNYNLGYIQFVSETGTPVTPPDSVGADDISYSYATNVAKFDLDNGTTDIGQHLNGLLRTVGARKAMLAQDRFIKPDFMLMSYTLNNSATNANNFEADSKRNGSDTTSQGDLDTIKGIPAFSTNAPGVDLGDERAVIGQRGTLTYTIAKPFVTGQPFESVAADGRPTGQKQAYGEEYSAIKVPTPIRNRLTSVLAYSFSGR